MATEQQIQAINDAPGLPSYLSVEGPYDAENDRLVLSSDSWLFAQPGESHHATRENIWDLPIYAGRHLHRLPPTSSA